MQDKKPTIAVMMRDVNSDFSEAMYSGMSDEAKEENVNLVFLLGPQSSGDEVYYSGDDIDNEYVDQLDSVFDYAGLLKPDALILVSGSLRRSRVLPDINALTERYRDIPLMVLETIPGKPSIAYQVADSYQPMCECVEHLIVDHGRSFIVYVSGNPEEYDFRERLRAFKDTMNAHSLDYSADQIVICDSPDNEERIINAIFDDFPYMDALVCSSDIFARMAYRACNKRGIVIGRDISVTGFDDLGLSHPMTPELTGVMYNSYVFGCEAVKKAVRIAQGQRIGGSRIQCRMVTRNSCGCIGARKVDRYQGGPAPFDEGMSDRLKKYIDRSVPLAIEDIFSFLPYESEKIEFGNLYKSMFSYIYSKLQTPYEDIDEVSARVNGYISELTGFDNLSNRMVTEKTTIMLEDMMYMLPHGRERAKLITIMTDSMRQLKEAEIVRMRDNGNRIKEQLWFIPLFTKDLLDINKSDTDVLTSVMSRLRGMDVTSAHIFLFDKPVVYRPGQLPPAPTQVHYAGHFDNDGLNVYMNQNSVNIDLDNGISSVLSSGRSINYSAFVICSGNRQYGIILYEINKKDIFFAMMCTLQIGALFYFRDISHMADETAMKLKVKEDILGFLSQRDDLTGILNGRGFMERFMHLVNNNNGAQGFLLFADVSHLKEINETYGHQAGDSALKESARVLGSVLGEENMLARIGDDEFISVILSDNKGIIDSIKKSVDERFTDYNRDSGEPYELRAVLGAYPFVCEKNLNSAELLSEACAVMETELKPVSGLRTRQIQTGGE